jgi:hypothetical protein
MKKLILKIIAPSLLKPFHLLQKAYYHVQQQLIKSALIILGIRQPLRPGVQKFSKNLGTNSKYRRQNCDVKQEPRRAATVLELPVKIGARGGALG